MATDALGKAGTTSTAGAARRRTSVAMLADVAAERLDLANLLETLAPEEWQAPSLCDGWTVRDVVAHLTLSTRQSFLGMFARTIRAREDFNRVVADMACERAAKYNTAELIAQLRTTAGADRRLAMSGRLDPLTDILVHGQDIARPLGIDRAMPISRVIPALQHVWGSKFYGAQERFAGLKLVATDSDWSAGEGPEVRGPIGDLFLLAAGRSAGLTKVSGSRAAEVSTRFDCTHGMH